jgi:hypothetical protein
MRHARCCVVPGLFLAALAGNAAAQLESHQVQQAGPIRPRIASVTHVLNSPVSLVFAGTFFPANQSQTKQRLFRMKAPAWSGGGEDVYYVGQPSETLGAWTSTRAEVMLPNIPLGRTFTIGLGEKEKSSPDSTFVLLSNEVQHLVPINLFETTPQPVPLGTSEIVGRTTSKLGLRAGRVVKLDGQKVNLTTWNADDWNFAFTRPSGLVVPSIRELWIESAGGLVLSTKLRVRFLGPPPPAP